MFTSPTSTRASSLRMKSSDGSLLTRKASNRRRISTYLWHGIDRLSSTSCSSRGFVNSRSRRTNFILREISCLSSQSIPKSLWSHLRNSRSLLFSALIQWRSTIVNDRNLYQLNELCNRCLSTTFLPRNIVLFVWTWNSSNDAFVSSMTDRGILDGGSKLQSSKSSVCHWNPRIDSTSSRSSFDWNSCHCCGWFGLQSKIRRSMSGLPNSRQWWFHSRSCLSLCIDKPCHPRRTPHSGSLSRESELSKSNRSVGISIFDPKVPQLVGRLDIYLPRPIALVYKKGKALRLKIPRRDRQGACISEASLAQLAERLFCKQKVFSSILKWGYNLSRLSRP